MLVVSREVCGLVARGFPHMYLLITSILQHGRQPKINNTLLPGHAPIFHHYNNLQDCTPQFKQQYDHNININLYTKPLINLDPSTTLHARSKRR